MCDFCGCRGQAPIDELSREHERLLDVIYQVRRDAARDDHPTVVETFAAEFLPLLRRHTAKEEQGLFAQLRTAWAADERLRALVAEHRRIEKLLDVVLRGDPGWRETVVQLGDELSAHIFDEETDLFPYALYELRDEQWAAVAAAHERTRDEELAVSRPRR